jgi:hypothetical protein
MVSSLFLRASLLSAATSAWAAVVPSPRPNVQLEERDTTPVNSADLSGFAPYTQFARAAYCDPSIVQGWGCGEACDAVQGFEVTLTGGDGNGVQYYFVGYWPEKNSVVVAHQGTDPTQLVSVLTDGNVLVDPLDQALFPGIPGDVQVHDGFRNEQALTAAPILEEVKKLMAAHSTNTITTVGHSLGGALAEIDAVFFRLNIPDAKIISRTYGTPRVGNPQWADYFDTLGIDFKRINNKKDIVPIVPGRGLGFSHPTGEVHILNAGEAVSCPGQDDATDGDCQISTVPNIFDGNVLDHLGPYEGISIGTIYCT